ncbi:MAG: helix-turn-helix domain-containing protein [Treponema sp.]|jgi:hypothetical protein|nr:helix-turn-helix domain-containing protein [Treponema sp.]
MEELYTVREVADRLKISVSSVYRYVESGVFRIAKLALTSGFPTPILRRSFQKKTLRWERPYPPTADYQERWAECGIFILWMGTVFIR